MRRTVLLATAVLMPCSAVRAQWLDVQPGTKVRITAPSVLGARVEGIVAERRIDTIVVVRAGRVPVRVPMAAITEGDVSVGKSRRVGAWAGTKWGAAIGLGMGLMVAAMPNAEWDTCTAELDDCYDPGSDAEYVVSSVVSSAVLGAGIGALIGKERWERLAAPVSESAARVWVAPTPRHGVAVGMHAAF